MMGTYGAEFGGAGWGDVGGGGRSAPSEPDSGGASSGRDKVPIITITNLSNTGNRYNAVNNRLTEMENNIDADCFAFLESGGHALSRHIRDVRALQLLAVGNFSQSNLAAIAGTYGTDLAEGVAAIVINVDGAYFSGSRTVNRGRILGGTAKAQVFILLHELAHSLEAKGFLSDYNNAQNGQTNDELIATRYEKTLARFQ
jgi:hypothetical protein